MPTVRIGLVGYGNAARFHVPALRQLGEERCELMAVWGRSRERAEGFARQYGIPHGSAALGKSLSEAGVVREGGAMVLAVMSQQGQFHTNPPPETPLTQGHTLIAVGSRAQVEALKRLVSS